MENPATISTLRRSERFQNTMLKPPPAAITSGSVVRFIAMNLA